MLNRSEIKLGARAAVWQRPLGPVLAVLLARLPGIVLGVSAYSIVRYLIAGRMDLHGFFVGLLALCVSLFVTLPLNVSLAGYFIALVSGSPQRVPALLAIFSDMAQYRHAYFTGLNVFARQAVWCGLAFLPCALSHVLRAAHAVPPPALNALWLTASEAVDMSVAATRGRMSELLLLLASFLPWLLLCVATAGLASLWVMPYLDATLAAYYLILKRQEGIRLPTPKEYTDV